MEAAVAQATPMMSIQDATAACVRKMSDFSGRAGRAEFWWWNVAALLASLVLLILDWAIILIFETPFNPLGLTFVFVILLPGLSVTARRLHDIGKSGWWQTAWIGMLALAWLPLAAGAAISLAEVDFDLDYADTANLTPAVIGGAATLLIVLSAAIWAVAWMARPGQSGANRYGSNPLEPAQAGDSQPKPMMSIQEAVTTVLRKYSDFSGRANRPELWLWHLAIILLHLAFAVVDTALVYVITPVGPFGWSFGIIFFVPYASVTARRLHDIGKSGWWQMAWIGIVVVAWAAFAAAAMAALINVEFDFGALLDSDYTALATAVGAAALLVTLATTIWGIVWLARPGQSGANQYGADPRAAAA